MKYKKILLLFCFGLFLCQASLIQAQPDQLYLSTDRPIYHAGETIWYTVFFLNEDINSIRSSVIHIQLSNQKGEVVSRQKLKRKNRNAHAQLRLPPNLPSGNYQLSCGTLWNKNFPSAPDPGLLIPIINLTNPDTFSYIIALANAPKPGELEIKLDAEPIPKKGENISFSLSTQKATGQAIAAELCISVVDLNWVDSSLITPHGIVSSKQIYRKAELKQELSRAYPAENSLVLSGELKDVNSKTPIASNFLALHELKTHQITTAQSKDGNFQIPLEDFNSSRQFQLNNLNPLQSPLPEINLKADFELGINKNSFEKQIIPEVIIENYFETASNYQKIKSLFTRQNQTLDAENQAQNNVPDFSNADKVYLTRDYENLDNLGEFIDEIILTTRVDRKANVQTVRLFNRDNKNHYPFAPWYFVDGYVYGNEADLLELPISSIERVEIYSRRNTIARNFGRIFAGSGVISIYSQGRSILIGKKDQLNLIDIPGFQQSDTFETNNFKEEEPDFRPTVYWNPLVQTGAKGKANVQFKTSDARRRFLIRISGVAEDGSVGDLHYYYTVGF